MPDVVVQPPKDEQIADGITREANLPRALENTGALDAERAAAATVAAGRTVDAESDAHSINPALIGTAKDTQLQAAVKYLLIPRARTAL